MPKTATAGACLRGAMITTSNCITSSTRHRPSLSRWSAAHDHNVARLSSAPPRQARAVADGLLHIFVLVMIIAPRRQARVVANAKDAITEIYVSSRTRNWRYVISHSE